jgi:ABC-type multidrug transport system fused ATPase/permease subunit
MCGFLPVLSDLLCCVQGMSSEEQNIKTKYKLLPANWPTDGSITFQDVKTVISTDSSQVLDGMSFEIEAGQKIGEFSLHCVLTYVVLIRD